MFGRCGVVFRCYAWLAGENEEHLHLYMSRVPAPPPLPALFSIPVAYVGGSRWLATGRPWRC